MHALTETRQNPAPAALDQTGDAHPAQPDADAVYQALWANDLLRCLDYGHVTATVDGSSVTLRGHVTAAHTRQWAEQAAGQVPGVATVENYLVVDDDVLRLVCQALAQDPRTAHEIVQVGVRHGVVILSGMVSSPAVRDAAEDCAASVPQVRGVSNFIEAPGVFVQAEDERVLQPGIEEEVIAADMSLGRVSGVIINPHNRRVTGFVTRGEFPEPDSAWHEHAWDRYETPTRERAVVIPVQAVGEVTHTAVWLCVSAADAACCPDFDPASFRRPAATWQPPYPYQTGDVWLDAPSHHRSRGGGQR